MDSIDVVRRCDITYRQLDYWCRLGLVQPAMEEGLNGRPTRVFNAAEYHVVQLMARLVKCGVCPADAAKLARGDDELKSRLSQVLKECG